MFLDPVDSPVYYLLRKIVIAIVNHAEAVRITPTPQPDGVCFCIVVHTRDIGHLIGMQGQTAQSLRVILQTVGTKMRRRYSIAITKD